MATPYHLPKKRSALKGTRISFLRDAFRRVLSHIDWIKKYIFENLKNYMALGPTYNLLNIYKACCPSYILPKTNEDKARSTKPKT